MGPKHSLKFASKKELTEGKVIISLLVFHSNL